MINLLSGLGLNTSIDDPVTFNCQSFTELLAMNDPVKRDTIDEYNAYLRYKAQMKTKGMAYLWAIGTPLLASAIVYESALLLWKYTDIDHRNDALWIPAVSILLMSPSAGHLYAHNIWRPILFTSLRAISFVIAYEVITSYDRSDPDTPEAITAILSGFLLGGASILLITAVDVVTSATSVKEYNQRLKLKMDINFKPNSCRFGIACRF